MLFDMCTVKAFNSLGKFKENCFLCRCNEMNCSMMQPKMYFSLDKADKERHPQCTQQWPDNFILISLILSTFYHCRFNSSQYRCFLLSAHVLSFIFSTICWEVKQYNALPLLFQTSSQQLHKTKTITFVDWSNLSPSL